MSLKSIWKDLIDGISELRVKDINDIARAVIALEDNPTELKVDESLKFENGVMSVVTTTEVALDNTLPVQSAAVASTVGNIEILLKTI